MDNINFKNLIYLYGGSYDKCKSNKIRKIIDEFNDGKLKSKNNKKITNKKQAIAIALNEASNKCKYNDDDIKKLIEKVNENLNNIDKNLNLTNLIETKEAIQFLIKYGKLKKVYIFRKLLWDKIIDSQRKNILLDKNMWDEIKKIHNL